MTAEIAILNKMAVALATDSAVTISAGQKEEKVFDSGDKLFELSFNNPIAIMIYNNLQFAEIPLPVIIKDFRGRCSTVSRVQHAADEFLLYLDEVGRQSSSRIQNENILSIVGQILNRIESRFQQKLLDAIAQGKIEKTTVEKFLDEVLGTFERAFKDAKPGSFVGGPPELTNEHRDVIQSAIAKNHPSLLPHAERVILLLSKILLSNYLSSSLTGVVFAGFGDDDIFPTLIAYEIDGMVLGRLKKEQVRFCDIDRDGDRAAVIPFAQKEMVDRFLYGLDDDIEREITNFAKQSISTIGKSVAEILEFTDEDDRSGFEQKLSAAEAAFVDGMKKKAFEALRKRSKKAIEDIVEFMPKPEIGRMAEALVELTSIKRRVSRGMETVREPIDVAVISRGEGFIWMKRKHYFSPELNPRYQQRVTQELRSRRINDDSASRQVRPNDGARTGEEPVNAKGSRARGPRKGHRPNARTNS